VTLTRDYGGVVAVSLSDLGGLESEQIRTIHGDGVMPLRNSLGSQYLYSIIVELIPRCDIKSFCSHSRSRNNCFNCWPVRGTASLIRLFSQLYKCIQSAMSRDVNLCLHVYVRG